MAYGPDLPSVYRRGAEYVRSHPSGARPDPPVEELDKFKLILNRKTAKLLGIDIPPTLLACADEVIEEVARCPLLAESRHGPSHCTVSAFGGKADMPFAQQMSAFDPKRT